MKLNIGCGQAHVKGYVNCDVQAGKRTPDLICDARSIPLDDGVASEVMALHLIEHFYRWEAPAALGEWRRLLKPGGLLVLELPNLEAACRNLLAGTPDSQSMWPLYGDPSQCDPYMCHRWGYTPKTLAELLTECGFTDIKIKQPQTHGRQVNRDMRAEAIR